MRRIDGDGALEGCNSINHVVSPEKRRNRGVRVISKYLKLIFGLPHVNISFEKESVGAGAGGDGVQHLVGGKGGVRWVGDVRCGV